MPKGSRKGVKEYENDGRPPELTFASFLTGSLTSQSSQVLDESCSEDSGASTATRGAVGFSGETSEKTLGFFVQRTKKGKLPISYENRAKGKKVTVIANVSGDANILLQELKKKIGAGGVVRGETVELQGDHQVQVEKFLLNHKSCLK
ncbi:unnamed protein product [Porites evermanni]|uniref:SUI1 domain-containing protein n=1 Tax=Porites evermanni TaxID=104178 RepID=A0ABN8SZV9_9CNID|nr:unnamed protein product [Porites evermanni]